MASMIKVVGVEAVISKLRKSHKTIGDGIERGLKKGGLFLQRESQKVVPVLTGNLRGGASTRNIGGKRFEADIVVGYGQEANYAVYVHENLDAKHKEGKSAKFLERPARNNREEIVVIIANEARRGIR